MSRRWHTVMMAAVLALTGSLAGCKLIDDDLTDCGTEPQEGQFTVNYAVTLHTNLSTQIQTVLNSRNEAAVARLLEDSLRTIFREYASDVDLSFYTQGVRTLHDQHVMNANQRTYTLELPAANYRHLALANVLAEAGVDVSGSDRVADCRLSLAGGDTLESQRTGLFTARHDMDIRGDRSQTFNVQLYMVNSASALVVNTNGVAYSDMRVVSGDFADGFAVDDSLYLHRDGSRLVRDIRVVTPPAGRELFYSACMPSCDTPAEAHAVSRAGGLGSDDPQVGDEAERIWRKYAYVTLPDGTVTRTVLNVREPLQAGQVRIIYAYLQPDGSLVTTNVEVGTSVTLDWQEGLVIRK